MPSTRLLAFGLLLAAGFPAGFCLSAGSARYVSFSAARAAAGGGEHQGAGGGGGGHQGAANEGGGSQGGAGGASGAKSNGDGHDGTGKQGPGGEKPAQLAAASVLNQDAVRLLLAGNTLRNERGGAYRYLSRRGWEGVGSRTSLVARRWAVRGEQLCTVGQDLGASCTTLRIARDPKPGVELGAHLGSVTTTEGARFAVLRGNVAQMPEAVPLLDGRGPGEEPRNGAPSMTGPKVMRALIGHSAALRTAGETGLTGFHFGPDGEWVTARPLAASAGNGFGGVQVSVGQWAMRGDTLCLDRPGLDLDRTCYRPQLWDSGAVRLTPSPAGGPVLDLSVVPDGA